MAIKVDWPLMGGEKAEYRFLISRIEQRHMPTVAGLFDRPYPTFARAIGGKIMRRAIFISLAALSASFAGPTIAQDKSWGISPTDWNRLTGDALRDRLRAASRQTEIEHAADSGDVRAMTIAAGALSRNTWGAPDYIKSFRYATAAAEAGDPRAMHLLATLYLTGNGIDLNNSKAYYWADKGARLGSVQAMLAASYALASGTGVQKNEGAAFDWSRKAADLNDPYGLFNVASFLFQGLGVQKNIPAAFTAMLKAAEAGSPEGMYWYGRWLNEPSISGEQPDPDRSTAWIGKSANAGLVGAMIEYAARLRSGIGIAHNPTSAAAWLGKAADTGDLYAKFTLASMLSDSGSGVPINMTRAKNLYFEVSQSLAASAEYAGVSLFNLGVISSNAGDYIGARSYYTQSLDYNYEPAKAAIASLDDFERKKSARTAAALQAAEEQRLLLARRQSEAASHAKIFDAPINGPNSPSRRDILNLHALLNARYYGGSTTSTPGEHAFPSPFGSVAYYRRRNISNASCVARGAGVARCSYDLTITQVAARDSLFGQFSSVFVPKTTNHWTYDFIKNKSGWSSKALEASIAQDSRNSSANNGGSNGPDYEAQRKERERQAKFTECMSRSLEYGHAPNCA